MNTPYLGISMLIHITIVVIAIIYRRLSWLRKKFQQTRLYRHLAIHGQKYCVKKPVKAIATGFSLAGRVFSSLIIFTIMTLIMLNAIYILYKGGTSPSSNLKIAERELDNINLINYAQ